MEPIEHLTVCTSEEAGEVAELAFELGKISLKLSKDLHKALRFGFTDIDPATGLTKIEMLVNELIDLNACIELLQEAGVPLFGIDNRDKIEAKKKKVMHFLNIGKDLGTVTEEVTVTSKVNEAIKINLPFTSKVVREITVANQKQFVPMTLDERNFAIKCLTNIYNPLRQQEFAKQIFEHVVEKLNTETKGSLAPSLITEQFFIKLVNFKNELLKCLLTGHKYNTSRNQEFMKLIDIQLSIKQNGIIIQPNVPLEILMNGVAPVNFFIGYSYIELNELWDKHKHEFK